MPGKGKPFTKNDPRSALGRGGGRPKKSVTWKEAEDALREALPRILLMPKNELARLLAENPTGAEMIAAKYLHENVPATVNRFLGKTPDVLTGKDGAPLIPAAAAPVLPPLNFTGWDSLQIDKFIAATAAAAAAKKNA